MSAPARALRRLLARRAGARAALLFVGANAVLALGADLVASDAPLVASVGGGLHVLPALFGPVALAAGDLNALRSALGPDDWMLEPPVPWGPHTQDRGHPAFAAPDGRHPLGTDGARRDVLARLVHGARVALAVGLGSVLVFVTLGTLLGVLAGYAGGAVDAVICRAIEVVLSIPTLFLLLAVMAVREEAGLGSFVLVLGLVSWTRVARLTRNEARRVRRLDYVQAAEALGLPSWRVVVHHVLPNSLTPAIVAASFGVAWSILAEATLSFLGFGLGADFPSWGGLMQDGLRNTAAWWVIVFPGLVLFATVATYNALGETLREALDPRAVD